MPIERFAAALLFAGIFLGVGVCAPLLSRVALSIKDLRRFFSA